MIRMLFSTEYFKTEIKPYLKNILLLAIPGYITFTIYEEMKFFIIKGGHEYSKLISQKILTMNQEVSLRVLAFSTFFILLITAFIYSAHFNQLMSKEYCELTLTKPIKSKKLIIYKLVSAYIIFIVITFIPMFLGIWIASLVTKNVFDILFFVISFLIHVPLMAFFWISFILWINIIFNEPKVIYPILLITSLINAFPNKYSLGYIDYRDYDYNSVFLDAGLVVNRVVLALLSILLVYLSIKLLEARRKNIFESTIKRMPKILRYGNYREYRFRREKAAKLILSFKINLSWKIIIGIAVVAIMPLFLYKVIPQITHTPATSEFIVPRILRFGEIFLPFATILYCINGLNIERASDIEKLIASKIKGKENSNWHKLSIYSLFSIVLIISYYFGICMFSYKISITHHLIQIAPPVIFYLMLVFIVTSLVKRNWTAYVTAIVVWAFNIFQEKKLPFYLSTFPNSIRYSEIDIMINKTELLVLSAILFIIFIFLNRRITLNETIMKEDRK